MRSLVPPATPSGLPGRALSLLPHHARRLLAAGTPWAGLGGDALAHVLTELDEDGWLVVVDA